MRLEREERARVRRACCARVRSSGFLTRPAVLQGQGRLARPEGPVLALGITIQWSTLGLGGQCSHGRWLREPDTEAPFRDTGGKEGGKWMHLGFKV